MPNIAIRAGSFSLVSAYDQVRGFTRDAQLVSQSVDFNYALPDRAQITSVLVTATVVEEKMDCSGGPTDLYTEIRELTANNVNFISRSADLSNPTEIRGTYTVLFRFRPYSRLVPGYDSQNITVYGRITFENLQLIISYTVPDPHAITTAVTPAGGGTLTASAVEAYAGDTVFLTATPASGYHFVRYNREGGGSISGNTLTMTDKYVKVTAVFEKTQYSIATSVEPTGGGTLTVSKTRATAGETVNLTPNAATGYRFVRYDRTGGGSISGNVLTMTAADVSVKAVFEKITYSISSEANPSGAGTVTRSPTTAVMGTTITLTQQANTNDGYYFTGWSSTPAVTITNNQFTMPAGNVSVKANFARRSTGSLNNKSMIGGGSVILTISTENAGYTHKYNLSFGSGMETGLVNVAAGVTSLTIQVPDSWSSSIPNATTKTGGTLTLETYRNGTKIGEYTITGLTYNVPGTAVPTIGTITTAILRTIGTKTYSNVGNYYVQGHSGVSISTSAAGALGSTIAELSIGIGGYTGTDFNKKVTGAGNISLNSGLLTKNGKTTITVTAKDSRGRTATKTAEITVTGYQTPTITNFRIWRVDEGGTADDFGSHARYEYAYTYTALGSNAATVKLKEVSSGTEATNPGTPGDLMPGTGNRRTYVLTDSYTYTLTVQDAFEKTELSVKVPTGNFILYVDETGKKIAFGKASTETTPAGKSGTFEIDEGLEVYIGRITLKDYIQGVINGTI